MNDCNKCIWARRDGGCNSWDCTFIDQTEAANAYTDRLARRMRESPVMVLRQPERKTGRWERVDYGNGLYNFHCSQCRKIPRDNILSGYCPHCGSYNGGEN